MKNKIAPEIDSLMWKLAEEKNERAIDEFGIRYPDHRAELLRRMSMVDGLRDAKKSQPAPPPSIPRFVPKEPRGLPAGRGVVFALVLAALAAFAFAATVLMSPAHHPAAVEPKAPEQTVVKTETPPAPAQKPATVETPPVQAPEEQHKPTPEDIADEANSKLNVKQKQLRIDNAELLTVLKMIGESAKVKVIPAPGIANPKIEVDYTGMSAFDMLRDLGHKYAFIAIDEHDGTVLLVPGLDKGPTNPGTTSGSEGPARGLNGRKIGG